MKKLTIYRFYALCMSALILSACQTSEKADSDIERRPVMDKISKKYPDNITEEHRVTGAIFGYLAGDALGLGTHWYYNLDELHKDYGTWIDGYQDPALNGSHGFAKISRFRFEQGLRAGDVSQTGQIFTLLLESVVDSGGFVPEDFHHRLDAFFATLSGDSFSGRYTESIITALIKSRRAGVSWDNPELATTKDSSDGAQLSILLAVIYKNPEKLAMEAERLMTPLIKDPFIRQNQIVYALVLQALIKGVQLSDLRTYLIGLNQNRAYVL